MHAWLLLQIRRGVASDDQKTLHLALMRHLAAGDFKVRTTRPDADLHPMAPRTSPRDEPTKTDEPKERNRSLNPTLNPSSSPNPDQVGQISSSFGAAFLTVYPGELLGPNRTRLTRRLAL